MYISKKHLPRRTFLRGAGAAIALPLLDAMIPARTALAATAAKPIPRLGFIYFPHGAVMDRWSPAATGKDFELPQILKPLEAFRDQMTIVSGLRNKAAESPAPHAITPGTWLNCVAPAKSHDPQAGTSADQVAAQHIGQDTPFPSLELCTEGRRGSGACDPVYGCSYSATVSFRTPTQPLPMEYNPRNLFYRLFGQGDTPEERAAVVAQTGSLLDLVADSASALQRELGAQDRVALDEYLDSVREVERQIQKLEQRDLSGLELPDAPVGVPAAFPEHLNLMFDLLALAYQANLTRVATFMMAAEVSMITFNHIGVPDAFHSLSHHQNNPDKLDRLAKVQAWQSEMFGKFLSRLAVAQDGDGTLLDHSIILFGSNMSNSDLHDHNPLPSALFGRAYGRIQGGRHLKYPPDTPFANLLVTMLDRAGIPVESHGDSTGQFAEV
jgi:hypothetical protein